MAGKKGKAAKAKPLHHSTLKKLANQKAFLAAYAECGTIRYAAEAVGLERSVHFLWMHQDPEYADAFASAQSASAEALEKEARRRAVQGVDEPVFYQGEECGYVRKYSDTLLIFLLKGALPDKYKDRHELSGGADPIKVTDPGRHRVTDDQLANIIRLAESAGRPALPEGTAGTESAS